MPVERMKRYLASHRSRPRVGHAHVDRLERRALLAGDFVSAFDFAPLAVAGAQAESAATVDAAGNVIMAGAFAGTTIDLDPSGGATNLVSTSGGDAYVANYSQAGALVWARQIRSTSGGAGEFAKGWTWRPTRVATSMLRGSSRGRPEDVFLLELTA